MSRQMITETASIEIVHERQFSEQLSSSPVNLLELPQQLTSGYVHVFLHHPAKFVSLLKAIRWVRRGGGAENICAS